MIYLTKTYLTANLSFARGMAGGFARRNFLLSIEADDQQDDLSSWHLVCLYLHEIRPALL